MSYNSAYKGSFLDRVIQEAILKTNTEAYSPVSDYNPATKKYVDEEISKALSLSGYSQQIVTKLPDVGEPRILYLVKDDVASTESKNIFTEYIWITAEEPNRFEAIGLVSDEINLSNYLAKDNTEEYAPISDYNPATKKYTDDKVATIPTPDVSGQIATHNTSDVAHADIRTALDSKVDAVEGKQLSTNDFAKNYKDRLDRMTFYVPGSSSYRQTVNWVEVLTPTIGTDGFITMVTKKFPAAGLNGGEVVAGTMSSTDKTKLDGITAGAEVNVQSDWNNIDNTNDAFIKNKPDLSAYAIATDTTTALGNKVNTSDVGVANGVAELDATGKVPSGQLPSYVDDVLDGEYRDPSTFLDSDGIAYTPETGKIYVDTITNKTWRWSGSIYAPIGSDLALGETSATAYAGNKGKAVTDALAAHENDKANPHGVTKAQVGLSDVDNTSDINKPISNAVTTKLNDYALKTEPNYVLDMSELINFDSTMEKSVSEQFISNLIEAVRRKCVTADDNGLYTPIILSQTDADTIVIVTLTVMPNGSGSSFVNVAYSITLSTKKCVALARALSFNTTEDGTKFLADDGQYKVVPENRYDIDATFYIGLGVAIAERKEQGLPPYTQDELDSILVGLGGSVKIKELYAAIIAKKKIYLVEQHPDQSLYTESLIRAIAAPSDESTYGIVLYFIDNSLITVSGTVSITGMMMFFVDTTFSRIIPNSIESSVIAATYNTSGNFINRSIRVEQLAPKSSDGKDGDVWIQYTV